MAERRGARTIYYKVETMLLGSSLLQLYIMAAVVASLIGQHTNIPTYTHTIFIPGVESKLLY